MNPIDNMGNLLVKGDLVAVKVGSETLTGTITEIKEASTIMGKDQQQLPGLITIAVPINFAFFPQMPKVAEVYKMVKPPHFDKLRSGS